MTVIDPVTNWFELGRISTPSSAEAKRGFDSLWLARYARPKEKIGSDNRGKLKAIFSEQIENIGLQRKPTTYYNPRTIQLWKEYIMS